MITRATLILAAVFAAVSVAPQAMAQDCGARPAVENSLHTQLNSPGTYRTRFNVTRDGAHDPGLNTTVARSDTELSTPGFPDRYLTRMSSQKPGPGRTVRPQYTSWCYFQCMRAGIEPDTCARVCSLFPPKQ